MFVSGRCKLVLDIFVGRDHTLVIATLHWANNDGVGVVGIAHQNILHVANLSDRKTARQFLIYFTINCIGQCCKAKYILFLYVAQFLLQVHIFEIKIGVLLCLDI